MSKSSRTSSSPQTGPQTFKTKVAPEGENFMIQLPFDVRKLFGQARPPIVITVAKYSFRSTVSVYGGEYFIGIRRSHREAAKLKPGATVSITVALDDAPRVVEAPKDLAAALKKNAAAKAAWDALSFTHKKEHADALLDAKKPETRSRRLDKTIEMLLATPQKKSAAKKPSVKKKAAR